VVFMEDSDLFVRQEGEPKVRIEVVGSEGRLTYEDVRGMRASDLTDCRVGLLGGELVVHHRGGSSPSYVWGYNLSGRISGREWAGPALPFLRNIYGMAHAIASGNLC